MDYIDFGAKNKKTLILNRLDGIVILIKKTIFADFGGGRGEN